MHFSKETLNFDFREVFIKLSFMHTHTLFNIEMFSTEIHHIRVQRSKCYIKIELITAFMKPFC